MTREQRRSQLQLMIQSDHGQDEVLGIHRHYFVPAGQVGQIGILWSTMIEEILRVEFPDESKIA